MDIWGQLNELAHNNAKSYWHFIEPRQYKSNIKMTPYAIHYNGNWLQNYTMDPIYTELRGDFTGDYWSKKQFPTISSSDFFTINWAEYHRGIKQLPFGIRFYLLKGLTGFSATGKYMDRTYASSSKCPRCGQEEDFEHTIKCKHPGAIQQWEIGIRDVKAILDKNVGSKLSHLTITYLNQWHDENPDLHLPPETSPFYNLMQAQFKLGWDSFLCGRLSTKWDNHTLSRDSYGNKKRWIAAIIKKLSLTIWNMWDHRNSILHDPQGPTLVTLHNELNAQIRLEYWQGWDGLDTEARSFFKRDVDNLCQKALSTKKMWLQSVPSARRNVHIPSRTHHQHTTQNPLLQYQSERHLLKSWLQDPDRTSEKTSDKNSKET